VFGVFPQFFLDAVMAPAASGLLHPARYASGVLTGLARLPALRVPFDYLSPEELILVVACAAAGAALAWAYLRAREPGPVRLLRAAHTGSVNDYAAYAVAGMLAVIAVLTLT
jgi:multicomponent Na+:H+ antiporter subunit D